jgi:glycosyltransferase involved in cell wall biosynthesis
LSEKKTISIITPCYNEEGNVLNLYKQVGEVMAGIDKYEYEHIFIDNHSSDSTVAILMTIAAKTRTSRSSSTRAISAIFARRFMHSSRHEGMP